ncbi:TetR/AcrR family transcriptional regulator [Alloacidobacterium dinghuense]|uniref:TetR/AcrR family transcriptional regulator n=1 Tax=Alloacidobacterium dinghuense TaxID=2763107 RepID=A0A7G8BH33_9BACT|nr:TetR/AcrR family transcriptional regulator [Alloacidobacterium dinghuense]QNI31853.1 TetR/AcrR family transcriptional regulator [Alloacidobacterium dinghuense]
MARPRSIAAHRKVLEAALNLFAERGIDATSMDAIAETSGVSKATIYKHWRDKDKLCLEVLGYLHGVDEEAPVFDSGDLRADLIAQLNYQPAAHRKEMKERLLPHLMAYSAKNRTFGEQWRARVLERPRAQLRDMLKRGIQYGKLAKSLDPEVGIALLIGPMLYRHVFVNRFGGKIPADLAAYAADAFLAAYGVKTKKRHKRARACIDLF